MNADPDLLSPARLCLRVIDYGEYVAAWVSIPFTERPCWAVRRVVGEWQALRST